MLHNLHEVVCTVFCDKKEAFEASTQHDVPEFILNDKIIDSLNLAILHSKYFHRVHSLYDVLMTSSYEVQLV